MSGGDLWSRLRDAEDCKSLLRKHLTLEVVTQLEGKKTKHGGTLEDIIRAGCIVLDSGTGLRLSDADAYNVFSHLIDPIILDYHKCDVINHPRQDLGDVSNLPFSVLDDGDFIISTRVRTGRCLDGFRFPATTSKQERADTEQVIVEALSRLDGDLRGSYHPLSTLTDQEVDDLINNHYLPRFDDRMMDACGAYRNWPENRGIFYTDDKKFVAWVNEEDHLRIIAMEQGSDLAAVYRRFCLAVISLGKMLRFARHDKLGYVNSCPSNLGTALRASVLIKIPRLSKQSNFKEILSEYRLQARGTYGYGSANIGSVYDISNERRLGLTEIQCVSEMARGVKALIEMERYLISVESS